MNCISNYKYVTFFSLSATPLLMQGCFTDNLDDRHLPFVLEHHNNVTVETCLEGCAAIGADYAGVQFETVT